MPQPITETDRLKRYRQLIDAARSAAAHSYSPYSKFATGAAVLTESGQIYTGCNIENSNFADGICGERTAMVKALSDGHRKFQVIATVSPNAPDCWPCGTCRQYMSEFADGLILIVEDAAGNIKSAPFHELLPGSGKLER